MNGNLARLGLAILAVLVCAAAHADTIMLKNGVGQLIGDIVSETADTFVIEIGGAKSVWFKEDIEYVIQDGVKREIRVSATPVIPTATETAGPGGATPPIPLPEQTPVPSGFPPGGDASLDPDSMQPLLPAVLPRGRVFQVIGGGVRFREGPSLDFPIISTLPGRSILVEIEFAQGWLRAKTLEGIEGWIHPNFVRQMESVPCLVTGEGLNVREAPGEVYRSLDRLRRGDIVMKLEEREGWWQVLANETVAGWCVPEFLKPLTDANAYKPPMTLVQNAEAGRPIEMSAGEGGAVSFILKNDDLTARGLAKLLILHPDEASAAGGMNYVSEAILDRERLSSPIDIVNTGLPEPIAVNYAVVDMLTLLGERTAEGWSYTVTLPPGAAPSFAFAVQSGPNRGAVIVAS